LITKADDYPIHQTPDPIASGVDRNFYDRYFFNGHSADGSLFLGGAFGVYPHLNIMDGAFSVAVDGVQHNIRVSRYMTGERTDTHAGPLSVEVVEPLKKIRLKVEKNEHGVEADLVFQGRSHPLEEPRQRSLVNGRSVMDVTRMTQNGRWEGWISVHGKRVDVRPDQVIGVRDRSWGLRLVGPAHPQPPVPRKSPQIMWLWAPLQAEDREVLFYAMETNGGDPLVHGARIGMLDGGEPEHMADAYADLTFRPGTREIAETTLHLVRRRGRGEIKVVMAPSRENRLFLSGLGYSHPEWGHGFDKGETAVGYDSFEPKAIVSHAPPHMHPMWAHYQAQTDAEVTYPDGTRLKARGVLEQLILGDYEPAGLKGLTDPIST
jgi:hypothetical protein